MKKLLTHIASYFFLSGLLLALSSQVYAQTAVGTQIDNIGRAKFLYLNGSQDSVQSNLVTTFVERWGTLSLNKTVSDSIVNIGDTVQFKIVVGYTGNLQSSNVTVVDTVPSHFKILSSSKGTVTGNIVRWNAGNILPNATDTMIVTAAVKLLTNGTYNVVNTAVARDSVSTLSASTGVIIIVANRTPDVTLRKTVLVDTLRFGDILPYYISAVNTGNTGLTNVTLIDTLPSVLDFVDASDSRTKVKNGILTIEMPAMQIGDSISFTLRTRLVRIGNVKKRILNTVYLTAEVPTDSLTNRSVTPNRVTGTILIGRAAAASAVVVEFNPSLDIKKTASKDTVFANDTVDYKITLKNNGDTPLLNVVMNDELSSPLHTILLVSSNLTRVNNNVTLTLDTLAVGDSVTASIRTAITAYVDTGVTNTAFVKSSFTPDQSASVVIPMKIKTIASIGSIQLTKFASRDSVPNGDSVKYVIKFHNNGSVTLKNIVISDTLSPKLTKNVVLYNKGRISGNIVSYYRDSLAVGQTDSVVVVSIVNGDIFNSQSIVNTAFIESDQTFITSSTATINTIVAPVYTLAVTKSSSKQTVFTEDTVQYTIKVRNSGNRTLTNVVVHDTIPFQLTNISAVNAVVNGTIVSYHRDTLKVNQVDSFLVRASVIANRPNDEAILNTVIAHTDQTAEQIAQAVIIVVPTSSVPADLKLTKSVSKDTVFFGDTLTYTITVKNTGTSALTNVALTDTLPYQLQEPTASSNATVTGKLISFSKAVLAPGASEVITVIGRLSLKVFENEIVLNRVFAHADQVKELTAHALFVSKTDPTCRVVISADPEKVIGNGRSSAYLEVHLTNSLGNPKPDGSPILMTTTIGMFTNGQQSRVLYTVNGMVSDSLRAINATNFISNAYAIASADNGVGCKDEDTVKIVFYPGAIQGTVFDKRTEKPVLGAVVKAYSLTTDSLAGMEITKADGYYLIPVEKTDSFRVSITTINEFGKEMNVSSTVVVNVTGAGDPPTPNVNSVSGAVYYLVSHEPIAAQNIPIILQLVTSNTSTVMNKKGAAKTGDLYTALDTIKTDYDGTFTFKNIPAGKFLLTLNHPSLQGTLEMTNAGNGQYVINANIAITLNPNIIFEKTGPSRVSLTDTATYKIDVKNTGTLSTTNTVLIDSLHWAMKFISATGGGLYDPLGHRIIWNIGKMDSLSARSYDVKVRFQDTLKNSTQSLNRASITSNQTTPILDSVHTLLFLPPTMRMWKVANVQSALPGDTVLYSIKVKNTAGSRADSVVINDQLPQQIQFLGSQVRYYQSTPSAVFLDSVLYNNASHSISWKRDTVFVGDSATITLITRVRQDLEPGDHRYTNIASMTWNGGTVQSDMDSASSATVRSLVSYLRVTKQAVRKVLEIGDIATYIVRVTNTSSTSIARDIQVVDKIPFGFRYMNGSSFIDSGRIADPTGRKELLWLLKDSLVPGATIQLVYRLIVGAGAAEGNGINTAQAYGISQYGTQMISAEVAERVEVRRGVFTTHGLIIGKVFFDDNRNRYQDSAEVGVKGIELMMEDGTRIITGDDGKYSVPDVLPGEHVIRVRTHTLPKDAFLEMGYNDFARDSTSRFVRLTESGIARVDFYLARNISRPDSLILNQAIAKIGDFSIQRIASPRNIVFIEDQRLASMKLTGLNFEVGKAVLKPESFVTLKQLADILRDYPDQPLIIAGHTDSMKIATAEFPNNKILSMSRALAVKNYLVEREGINVDRIRIQGYGETKPLATNKSIEGRALNRRVEFYFTPSTDEKPITEMPMSIEIPIEYTGSENISKVDFRDVLDPSMKYVEGSATFGDTVVTPQINGNELHWKLTNLGANFKLKLRYSVMVQRPSVYTTTSLTSRSASICYFVGDSALKCLDTLTTTNQTAIAIRGRAVNFVMSGVLFDVAKASLRTAALSSLEVTAKFLKDDPSATALIEGHTDSSPIKTKEFPSNMELSYARANTIKQKLVNSFGIAPERLEVIGYGERRPLQSNGTKEGKQANRRIEMRILRTEFAQNVLPEGGVDSSKLTVETLLPKDAPKGIDSLMRDKSKERYILTLEVHRSLKRNTVATTIIDTIPAGMNLLKNSLVKVSGVDSITVQGKILMINCSPNAQLIKLYYIAEVSDDMKEEATLIHGFSVTKKQSDGSVVEERTPAVKIEVRKKRMLVRNQR